MKCSDEVLYERVRGGDRSAFDALYRRYERPLFGFVFRYVKRQEEAEEVFHETFMALLMSRDLSFDGGSFRAWAYRVARNRCLNRLRTRGRENRAHLELALDLPPAKPLDELLTDARASTRVTGAVARLSPALQEVFALRASGLSYDEMALALEIPVGTVKSRIHEMVRQIREEVQK